MRFKQPKKSKFNENSQLYETIYFKSKMVEYLIKLKQKTDKFIEYNLLYPIVVSNKFNMLDNVLFAVYFLTYY